MGVTTQTLKRMNKKQYLATLPQTYQDPWWLSGGKDIFGFAKNEGIRKMRGMGIRRVRRNWEQSKGTMLPIQEKELNEDFASRGMYGGSHRKRSLTKLREPYRRHTQRIVDARNLQKRAKSKGRIYDIINLFS